MVAVKKNQPATIQNTNEFIRDALKLSTSRSAVLNPSRWFLDRGGTLDTLVIAKPPRKRKIRPFHKLASSLRHSVSFLCFTYGAWHQLAGVWPEHPASAEIKTAKFLLKSLDAFLRKFAPAKISHYTVV